MTYPAGHHFWKAKAGEISKYGVKVNKFILTALCALKTILFLTQKSLIETFMHRKTRSLTQLQITSQIYTMSKDNVLWSQQSIRVKPHQGFQTPTIPNLTFCQLSKETLLLCHKLDVWFAFLCLDCTLKSFHDLVNSIQVWQQCFMFSFWRCSSIAVII